MTGLKTSPSLLIHDQKIFEKIDTKTRKIKKIEMMGSGVVILTSGSSGSPKGVLLKEENLFYSALGTNEFTAFSL